MKSIRILIADRNEAFRENLAELLGYRYTVLTCDDGPSAKALLRSAEPDILVLDLMLPNSDTLGLAREALSRSVEVYAFSGFISAQIQEQLLEMGVYGMLRTPCDIYQAETNIRAMAQRMPVTDRRRDEDKISEVLLRLGIDAGWDGYSQLLVAMPIYIRDPKQPLNKVICAAVAKRFGLSGYRPVEYDIRRAITMACDTGDTDLWKELFPPELRNKRNIPSNKQFIARLWEYLQRRRNTR